MYLPEVTGTMETIDNDGKNNFASCETRERGQGDCEEVCGKYLVI